MAFLIKITDNNNCIELKEGVTAEKTDTGICIITPDSVNAIRCRKTSSTNFVEELNRLVRFCSAGETYYASRYLPTTRLYKLGVIKPEATNGKP